MARKSEKRILLTAKGCVEQALLDLLSMIEDHNKGAQMHLREDIAKLYAYATEVRESEKHFKEFLAAPPIAHLKRPPKTADQVFRAVMNLAYPAKLASARFRRLKPSWDARVPPNEVQIDLAENGSSRRRVRLEIDQSSFDEFPLDGFKKGTEIDLMIQATVESAERLICKIVLLEPS